ncbi:MAG: hypothetical protein K2Q25_15615 [Mycobacteriaceae bacterium]|nr:hypothetical protein [Mycobacteriaceae bacterium]
MTEPPRIWADTQEWLADLDRDTPSGGCDDAPACNVAGLDEQETHNRSEPIDLARHDIKTGSGPADVVSNQDGPIEIEDAGSAAGPVRYNKTLALGFAAATVVAALVVSGVLAVMHGGTGTAAQDHVVGSANQVSVIAAPTTSGTTLDAQDSPIPYTATSVGCLAGSSAAQSVAGPDSTQAWVCVHGGTIGQYLVLDLGRSMVIAAVAITAGWVGADASGTDQWPQHRVPTRVQWSFNDSPPTVVPQDTGSVHGPAIKTMPGRGVLASRIIMLVQETARAPADVTPTNPTSAPGGLFGDVLGPLPTPVQPALTNPTAVAPVPPADQSQTDPADNTFAVSTIKIFGHPPQ